jgi:hypothetical protein
MVYTPAALIEKSPVNAIEGFVFVVENNLELSFASILLETLSYNLNLHGRSVCIFNSAYADPKLIDPINDGSTVNDTVFLTRETLLERYSDSPIVNIKVYYDK